MTNKQPLSLTEDQQWELARTALVASGLESVRPSEFIENGSSKTLTYAGFNILEYREARKEKPGSLLCEVRYGEQILHLPIEPAYQTAIPYKRRFEVFFSAEGVSLDKLRRNDALEDKDEGALIPVEIAEPIKAEESGLPENADFHASVYVQPTLQKTSQRTADLQYYIAAMAAPVIVKHAGLDEVVREKSKVELGAQIKLSVNQHRIGGLDTSGRSGIWTFRTKCIYKVSDKNAKVYCTEIEVIISLARTPEQKALLRHSANWQKALGQDAPEEERIPTPEIFAGPSTFADIEYAIQSNQTGFRHFAAGVGHVAELGKALGRIHNHPANEAEPAPVESVLYPSGLIEACREGLEAAEQRTQEGKKHGAEPRMQTSIQGQLLERFSWEELQRLAPDLCEKVGLTRNIAKNFTKTRERKARQDERLPKGLCHGDMHPKNLLTSGEKNISIIDFQGTGKGVFADELMLAMYFFCADDKGKLDPERTRAFFGEYCKARCRDDKSTCNIPLTQQEIAVLPERIASLAKRQTHPIWVMFREEGEEKYSTFAERNHALPEQMQAYMGPGGIENFTREFLGMELSEQPEYRPSMVEVQRARGLQDPLDSYISKANSRNRGSGASGQLIGSGV